MFGLAFLPVLRVFFGRGMPRQAMLLCGEISDVSRAQERETSSFKAQGRQLGFANHA